MLETPSCVCVYIICVSRATGHKCYRTGVLWLQSQLYHGIRHCSLSICPLEWMRDITLPEKVHLVKAMVFLAVIYGCELDHKESWAPKNWRFQTMVLEKTLENPLDCKEIKPVNPKGNQSSIFIGRTDAEAEAPRLWPPDVKNWLIRTDLDVGKDWRQEDMGKAEDQIFGWYHWLNGHEFEQALGFGDGQGSLACYSPWGHKESDMTEWLNWLTED